MRSLRDAKKRVVRLPISNQQAAGPWSHPSVKVSYPSER